MKILNRISPIFLMGLSVLIGFGSIKLGIVTPGNMGPGFVPFLASALLFILSLLILITFVLAIIASALKKYPFAGRTILYIAPLVLFFAAIGIWLTIRYLKKIHLSISILLLLFIFLLPVFSGIYHLIEPTYKSEIKSVINYYNKNKKPGDKLYVENYYIIQFDFYSDKNLVDYTDNQDIEILKKEIIGNKRVWVIGDIGDIHNYGKVIDSYKIKTLAVILSKKWPFSYISDKLIHLNDPNAEIYLYDFSYD